MKSRRVVIVDDAPEFLKLLDKALTEAGHVVTAVPHHQGIFNQIKEKQVDVIVVDIGLDNIAMGWQLVDMLYLDPATRATPVIVCAALTKDVLEAANAFEGKGILLLEKPFKQEDLVDVISNIEEHPMLQLRSS